MGEVRERIIIDADASGGIAGIKAFSNELQQLDARTGVAGQTFARTTGQFDKASRKYSRGIFKNLIKEVTFAGSSFLPAAGNIGVFAGALSSVPFLGAAVGAAGLGIALLTMAKHTDPAVEAAKRLAAAQAGVKKAVDASNAALDESVQAQVDAARVESTRKTVLQDLSDQRRRLSVWEKKFGQDSDQYRMALVGLREAEQRAREAAKGREETYAKILGSQVKSARAVDGEIQSLQNQRKELQKLLTPMAQQALGAEKTAKNQKELERVTAALNNRLGAAEGRHRANARAASDMAASISGADQKSKNLRDSLQKLAKQELNAAAIARFLSTIGGAAQNAFNAVTSLWGAVRNPPTPGGGGGGGGGKPKPGQGGKNQKGTHEFTLHGRRARPNPLYKYRKGLSFQETASAALMTFARDDSLQDKQAQISGETQAMATGATNPDYIRKAGELAVERRRRDENKQRQGVVERQLKGVRAAIAGRKKVIDGLYAKLKKTRDKKKRAGILQDIREKRDAIQDLYAQEAGLVAEGADLVAEANELGFNVGTLEGELQATPVLKKADGSDSTSGSSVGTSTGGTSMGLTPAPPDLYLQTAAGRYLPGAGGGDVTVVIEDGALGFLQQFIRVQVNGLTARARTRSLAGGRTF